MKKSMYWLIWVLLLVLINLLAVPCAFLAFTTIPDGTSTSLIHYLIPFAFLFIPNIVMISLFVSAKKENATEFFIGIGLAIVEVTVIASVFFGIIKSSMLLAVLIGFCAIGGIILVVKSLFLPSAKYVN